MNLVDRHRVEGTDPLGYIGHRRYIDRVTHKPKVCRPWYVEFNHGGVKIHKPLRTTNKSVAISRAHELSRRIAAGENLKASPSGLTLEVLASEYITVQRGKNCARKTITKYEYVLKELVAFAATRGAKLARQFTSIMFWAFSKKLIDDGLSEKTRYNYLTIVKQLFRWALGAKRIAENPIKAEELKEPAPTEQPCFTPAQATAILEATDDRNRGLYAFLIYTGARFGEAATLRRSDLQLHQGAHGFVTIQRGGSGGRTKGKRDRRIPLHPALRAELDRIPKHPANDLVFHAHPSAKYPDGSGPIDNRRALVALKRLCKRLKFEGHKKFKLHTFRHVFASMLAAKQVSYKYALEFMGHTESAILDLYYKMYDPVAEEAILAVTLPKPAAKPSGPVGGSSENQKKAA